MHINSLLCLLLHSKDIAIYKSLLQHTTMSSLDNAYLLGEIYCWPTGFTNSRDAWVKSSKLGILNMFSFYLCLPFVIVFTMFTEKDFHKHFYVSYFPLFMFYMSIEYFW